MLLYHISRIFVNRNLTNILQKTMENNRESVFQDSLRLSKKVNKCITRLEIMHKKNGIDFTEGAGDP